MSLINAYTWLQRHTDVQAKALNRKDVQPLPLATPVSLWGSLCADLPRSQMRIENSVIATEECEAEGSPQGGRPRPRPLLGHKLRMKLVADNWGSKRTFSGRIEPTMPA